MKVTGKLVSVVRDWNSGKFNVTFAVNEHNVMLDADKIKNCEKLSIEVKQYRNHRSQDANALMWACLGEIASALTMDKWDVYLKMLKRYGKYTYICVKPAVVDAVKAQWRETEVIGEAIVNGQKAVQMLCYFGSSTYNTKEFSVLLNGIISEMNEMGLETPMPQEMVRALELWERSRHENNSSD